jgi:hypothetical protein
MIKNKANTVLFFMLQMYLYKNKTYNKIGDSMLDYNNILNECKEYYIENIKKQNVAGISEEIIIMQLYDLVLNILNQQIFDYVYSFKKDDIEFLIKYNINIVDLINKFKKYI